jgi:arsenate reductase-like glutaredoxin family protein
MESRPTDEELTDSLNRSAAVIERVIEAETKVFQALAELAKAISAQAESLTVIQQALGELLRRSEPERKRRWF